MRWTIYVVNSLVTKPLEFSGSGIGNKSIVDTWGKNVHVAPKFLIMIDCTTIPYLLYCQYATYFCFLGAVDFIYRPRYSIIVIRLKSI